ncbi:MAG: valine--tRNA ligase [Alphaproteobacteria bacterium]|nr:valine--tRNA ligase [Alphaproteobacteria bacterium]
MIDKTFNPKDVENRLYEAWETQTAFAAHVDGTGAPYTIMMPPPNVTGSLHMGHGLNMTLQDVLTRFQRMRGRDALWQPGSDHAGIATQMVVERNLAAENVDRRDIGRDAFIEKVWEWKAHSGGTIVEQLKRLGASPDWARERFTMDEGLSKAVRTVFVQLYKEGLIYKDQRLVNWDPKFETAISDLEVQQIEKNGNLWHFRYPVEGEPDRYLVVATTRPETMLGDTGVAVHPDDPRYADLIGKHAILPLVGRRLKIVADEYADPEKGTGAVKMTPAHDFNDFEVGRRHDLELINIFDRKARVNENAPEAFRGMDRFEARKKVVEMMEAEGLLETIEDHVHMVPHGDRSGVPIEPFLTEQWYCDAKTLAKPAIEAVETGKTKFVPQNWEKTYFAWMRDIQPWCISRQLWWGHQIPAWYGPDGETFVEMTEEEAAAAAEAHYGKAVALTRDEDVLDTWFSSALWPFSTLGWPEKAPEVARYYPGDVLITGFDIIFFWVARMMMMGLHFMKDVPFHTVYIHALVRDEKGQKMSKSKGNVLDPLELIDEYGADATRFTLIALAAQGRDIKMSKDRIAGYRNFATKLWNAARFCEMNEAVFPGAFDPAAADQTVNRWIAGEVAKTEREVREALDAYRFDAAANALYHFIWGTFCDWYLEFSKPILNGEDAAAIAETRQAMGWALDQILLMLHPFMPFITEELWATLAAEKGRDRMAVLESWPDYGFAPDTEAADELNWLVSLITEIRSVRSDMNVPAGAMIPLQVAGATDGTKARLDRHAPLIKRLARIETISPVDAVSSGAIQTVLGEATLGLPLADVIDLKAEQSRLQKEISKQENEIAKIDKKLSNQGFLAKAPEEVVEENRERRAEAEDVRAKLQGALERLKQAG